MELDERQSPIQVGQTIQATNQVVTTTTLTKHKYKALAIITTTIKDELLPYVSDWMIHMHNGRSFKTYSRHTMQLEVYS